MSEATETFHVYVRNHAKNLAGRLTRTKTQAEQQDAIEQAMNEVVIEALRRRNSISNTSETRGDDGR